MFTSIFSSNKSNVTDLPKLIAGMAPIDKVNFLLSMENRVRRGTDLLQLFMTKDAHIVCPLLGEFSGYDGMRSYIETKDTIFAPATISGIASHGPTANTVTLSWAWKGKFVGKFEDIEPTNQEVWASGMTIFMFDENNMIAHVRKLHDGHNLREQMRGKEEASADFVDVLAQLIAEDSM